MDLPVLIQALLGGLDNTLSLGGGGVTEVEAEEGMRTRERPRRGLCQSSVD